MNTTKSILEGFLQISCVFAQQGQLSSRCPAQIRRAESKQLFRFIFFRCCPPQILLVCHRMGISFGDQPDRIELLPAWPLHAKFDSALPAVEVSLFPSLAVWQTCRKAFAGASGEAVEPLRDLGYHIYQQEMNACILKKGANTVNQPAQVAFPFYLKTAVCSQLYINEKPADEAVSLGWLYPSCWYPVFVTLSLFLPRRALADWFLFDQPGHLKGSRAETLKV